MYYIVYSPKVYKKSTVEHIIEVFDCQLVTKEYGREGTHPHANFIVNDDRSSNSIRVTLQKIEKGGKVWSCRKITSLDNTVAYICKEPNHKILSNKLPEPLDKYIKEGQRNKLTRQKLDLIELVSFCHWYTSNDILIVRQHPLLNDAPAITYEDLKRNEYLIENLMSAFVLVSGRVISESLREMLKVNLMSMITRYDHLRGDDSCASAPGLPSSVEASNLYSK